MYSFVHFSCALGSISSALGSISSALPRPLPVSRGRHGRLLDNFSPESDVTSLQDPFTECPASSFPYFLASFLAVLVIRIQHRISLFPLLLCAPPSLRSRDSKKCTTALVFRNFKSVCACTSLSAAESRRFSTYVLPHVQK